MMPAGIVAALLLAAMAQSAAQDVQRCEAADGKTVYVNGPCPGGTRPVRALPPAQAPNAADQKAAQQRARQDSSKVAEIDRGRKADEARAVREQERAENRLKKKQTHCRRLEARLRVAQEDLAGATLNKRAEAQRRLRRADELFTADCGPDAK